MGIFNQILQAVNNPNQQANLAELSNILTTIQQTGSIYGADPGKSKMLLSMVGGYVRSALQEKQNTEGSDMVKNLVNQFSGTSANPQAVFALFSQTKLAEIVPEIAQKSGLNAATIQAMLPVVVPAFLSLLKTGASTTDPQQAANPVLNAFLDADGDGTIDITDVMNLAGRFLK
jgi:hypothetical protein